MFNEKIKKIPFLHINLLIKYLGKNAVFVTRDHCILSKLENTFSLDSTHISLEGLIRYVN